MQLQVAWAEPNGPRATWRPFLTTHMDGNPPSLQLISYPFPQVLLARRVKYIAWTLLFAAQSSSAERLGVLDRVRHVRWNMGRETATCKICGRTFPRCSVTLSDFNSCKNASRAISRRSSWVSRGELPREQSAPSGEDAVMEDYTESHQPENDKLWKILTNMPEKHRMLTYGGSFWSKMQSLDDEETALLAAASGPCAPRESQRVDLEPTGATGTTGAPAHRRTGAHWRSCAP